MHVSVETLRTHIDYTVWASRKMLEAAAGLSPEELNRDFDTADKSVLGTLLHIYGGDIVWIERMYGKSLTSRPYDSQANLATIEAGWPPVWDRWREYVA